MPLDGTTYHGIDQDEVVAMLRRAKELIVRHGWCQDTMCDREGRVCLYEAMRRSGNWRNWSDLDGLPWPAVWQDEPGRTVEEVYAWLDEQIALREVA